MAETEAFRSLPKDKQDRVFKAAVSEFSEQGYGQASMNRVVKHASISKGSLFQYFHTKAELFESVVALAVGRTRNELRRTRDETSELPLGERLKVLIETGFCFIDDHPGLARIYFRLLLSGESPFSRRRLRKLQRQSVDFLAGVLRAAAERGELRTGLDVDRAAFLLNGTMQLLLHAYYSERVDAGLGLYRASKRERASWTASAVEQLCLGLVAGPESAGRSR